MIRTLSLAILFALSLVVTTSADTVSMQSDHLSFDLRVDDAPNAGSGNMDFHYRGIEYGISDSWHIVAGGTSSQLSGGTVVDGDPDNDEKVWNVQQGDLRFQVNFFIIDETPITWSSPSPRNGIGVLMNVELFNESATQTATGSIVNYGQMQALNQEGLFGSEIASIWFDQGSQYVDSHAQKVFRSRHRMTNELAEFPDFAAIGDSTALLQQVQSGTPFSSDTIGTIFGEDLASAAQWDFDLAPQASLKISYDFFTLVPVPEPGTSGVVGFMIVGCFLRRRRTANK